MAKDYIRYIRSMVGNKDIISVGLTALIINEHNQILLEKRSDNGMWCFPGGSIDIGETVEEGVRREVKEETGLNLGPLQLFAILSGEKQKFAYPNGDVTYYVDIYFLSRVTGAKPRKDDESISLTFFDFDALPPSENMLRGTDRMIKKYLSGDHSVLID